MTARPHLMTMLVGLLLTVTLTSVYTDSEASPALVADWQMNESAGANQMQDASGNGNHGNIGNEVTTGVNVEGATAYRWAFTPPSKPPVSPERIIHVPHDSALNPGRGDYAITIRYRTTQPFGNIAQKGQGGAPGGYWKIENPAGRFTCVFRGVQPDGSGWNRREVVSPMRLDDGEWHTARCERVGSQLRLTVDGTLVDTSGGSDGHIANDNTLIVGGKSNCNQVSISCDYFTGDIDYLTIGGSGSTEPPDEPPSGETLFTDGFSSSDYDAWGEVHGMSIDSALGAGTLPSARADTSGDRAYAYTDFAPVSAVCVEFSILVESTVGAVDIMRLRTDGNSKIARIYMTASHRLVFKSDVSGARRYTQPSLSSGWNEVKLCGSTGESETWDMYLNGSQIMSNYTANTGSSPVARLQIGTTKAETLAINYDDVIVTKL